MPACIWLHGVRYDTTCTGLKYSSLHRHGVINYRRSSLSALLSRRRRAWSGEASISALTCVRRKRRCWCRTERRRRCSCSWRTRPSAPTIGVWCAWARGRIACPPLSKETHSPVGRNRSVMMKTLSERLLCGVVGDRAAMPPSV